MGRGRHPLDKVHPYQLCQYDETIRLYSFHRDNLLRTGQYEMGSEDRDRQFFTAAEPLLLRYGFRKTTVEEICRAAGASKRTFYEHFRDKEDLLLKILAAMGADAIDHWRATVDPSMSALAKIESYIDGYEEFARAHPVFQQCMHEADLKNSDHGGPAHEMIQSMLAVLGKVIDEGIACGELRPVDTPTVVGILDGLLDTMYYVHPGITERVSALENPTLARELRAFVINGLRS